MPSTWQSWLLRVGTFLAIAAASWYTLLKNYSALGLSEYASMLQMVGNTSVMFAVSYIIFVAILYLLYTFFVRIAYNMMSRQLFFFDAAMSMYDFRLRLDIAVVALCVFKALISVVYMCYPLYEGIMRATLRWLSWSWTKRGSVPSVFTARILRITTFRRSNRSCWSEQASCISDP